MLANTVEPMDLVLFLVSWLGYILGAKKYSRRVFENVLAQSENQITNLELGNKKYQENRNFEA